MRIILVRHGPKAPIAGHHESGYPLDPNARPQAVRLRDKLRALSIEPDGCLTSRWQHAVDTAMILAAGPPERPVIGITGLTPETAEPFFTPTAILDEARDAWPGLTGADAVILVGHHPRLEKLAKMVSGVEQPELARLTALILVADSLDELIAQRARIERRVTT